MDCLLMTADIIAANPFVKTGLIANMALKPNASDESRTSLSLCLFKDR